MHVYEEHASISSDKKVINRSIRHHFSAGDLELDYRVQAVCKYHKIYVIENTFIWVIALQ